MKHWHITSNHICAKKIYSKKYDFLSHIFFVLTTQFSVYSVGDQSHSVQFSCSVLSDSLQPHGLQHARLPCSSPISGASSNSCPSSWWCHPTILSPVVPFSSCLRSFPASESFPLSQFFASDGQSIGVSTSASVLPMNVQDRFSLGLTGWISLQSKGLSGVFSGTTVSKHQFFSGLPSLWSNSHIHAWLTGKTIVLTTWTFVRKVMSLPFRFAIAFLSRSNCLLISWLQSPSSVILEPNKRKHVTASTFSPYLPSSNGAKSRTRLSNWTELNWMGLNAMILVFFNI